MHEILSSFPSPSRENSGTDSYQNTLSFKLTTITNQSAGHFFIQLCKNIFIVQKLVSFWFVERRKEFTSYHELIKIPLRTTYELVI